MNVFACKIILSVFFFFTSIHLFAQDEKAINKTVAEKFEGFYNNEKYDSIFAMFSPGMQKSLTFDKTTGFLKGLQQDAGKITRRQFIKYSNSYASYKTNFERALYTLNLSVESNLKLNGLLVKPFADESLPQPARNSTKLGLPFKDEWTIVWGGDTKALNYHVENVAQKNAFDIIITDLAGKSFKTDGKSNTDYYAFGKELIAPCDGEIVLAVDGIKDNMPGTMNTFHTGGNTIIIKTANGEFLVFCHFKQHSIVVKEGQKVQQGQLLGLCGNSGNSSEPHLHFHLQNTENIGEATGIKCYFDTVILNGKKQSDYYPIKNDRVKSE